MAVGVAWTRICDGDGGGVFSLSVALSDDSPNFGDTISVTATPTGIVPITYDLYVNGDFVSTHGASPFNYTVNVLSTFTVQVVAIDAGGASAVGVATGTASEILASTDLLVNDESQFNGAASLPDATAITSVSDQSGTSNTCNQSTVARQPAYYSNIINGLPAIRFGQTAATHLYSTNAPSVEMSITVVIKALAGTACIIHIAASYNDGADPFLIVYQNAGPTNYIYFRNAGGFNNLGRVNVTSDPHVITFTISSTLVSTYIDGLKVFERVNSGSAGARTATYIGGAYLSSFAGYIGHVEQQSRSITMQEVLEKHRVLADKWGITLNN